MLLRSVEATIEIPLFFSSTLVIFEVKNNNRNDSKPNIFLINIQFIGHKSDGLYLLLENLHFSASIAITELWPNSDEPVFVENHTTNARWKSSDGDTMDISTSNNFRSVTRFPSLISENQYEFSIVLICI